MDPRLSLLWSTITLGVRVIYHFIPQIEKYAYRTFRLNFGEGSVQEEQVNLTGEELEDQTSQVGSAEIINSGPRSRTIHQSASTVLFHICQALCQGHRIYKDVLRFLKAGAQSPHLVLRPFIFFLGLAMASVKKFRQSVGETLRAIFMKQIDMNIR